MSETAATSADAAARPVAPRLRQELVPAPVGLAFVAILVGAFLGLGWVAHRSLGTQLEVAGEHARRVLVCAIAPMLRDAVEQEGPQTASLALEHLSTVAGLCGLRWTAPDGQTRYQWPGPPADGAAGAAPASADGPQRVTVSTPVRSETGQDLGVLQATFLRRALPVESRMVWMGTGIGGGACLLAFLFLHYRMRRHLRPILAVQANLRQLALGVEHELLSMMLSDSLGQVAQAWNSLVQELVRSRSAGRPPSGDLALSVVQRFESRTLRGVLDRLPLGVLRVGPDGCVRYANAAAGVLLGHPADSLVGRPLAEVVEEETLAQALVGPRSRPSGRVSIDRKRCQGGGESMIRFQSVSGGMGGEEEALVTIQDVTHLREAERARDDFLYHVTHELRTPLTNIQAYAETLTKPAFDDEQTRKECYNVIISETRRLSRLVEDILSVSQLEVGTARIEAGDVDLVRLIRQMVQDNLGAADEKGVELLLKLPPKVPKMRGDKQRLSVMFNNLIGNAVKYTPKGGQVEVSVTVGERLVEVSVRDTGIGIAPADQPRVFEKFYRANSELVQSLPGTGLGLAIAREVARLHGGDIRLESEPGKGSTFTVELPRPASEV